MHDRKPSTSSTSTITNLLEKKSEKPTAEESKASENQLSTTTKFIFNSTISYGRRFYQYLYPYNGAQITGYRFPHVPRLIGTAFDGRLPQHRLNGGLEQFE
ncbi:MAG TPA: hypothetical protein VLH77_03540, partial [Gammaproteobacteria bacterium]|nr:hypothetical protein [Gammaproteobacteria bacterium]